MLSGRGAKEQREIEAERERERERERDRGAAEKEGGGRMCSPLITVAHLYKNVRTGVAWHGVSCNYQLIIYVYAERRCLTPLLSGWHGRGGAGDRGEEGATAECITTHSYAPKRAYKQSTSSAAATNPSLLYILKARHPLLPPKFTAVFARYQKLMALRERRDEFSADSSELWLSIPFLQLPSLIPRSPVHPERSNPFDRPGITDSARVCFWTNLLHW